MFPGKQVSPIARISGKRVAEEIPIETERDRLYPKGEDAIKLLCKSKHQIG